MRKKNLIDYGFRLPSAYDNRPLKFSEFEEKRGQTVYVSATPKEYERNLSTQLVEQIIRPTGLLDPKVIVRPTKGQIDDLAGEIRIRAKRGERVLVTTLTRKMAEDLTEFFELSGIKSRYLHYDIDTIERRRANAGRGRGARTARRRIRRSCRHKPPARGARSAGGFACRHTRRR